MQRRQQIARPATLSECVSHHRWAPESYSHRGKTHSTQHHSESLLLIRFGYIFIPDDINISGFLVHCWRTGPVLLWNLLLLFRHHAVTCWQWNSANGSECWLGIDKLNAEKLGRHQYEHGDQGCKVESYGAQIQRLRLLTKHLNIKIHQTFNEHHSNYLKFNGLVQLLKAFPQFRRHSWRAARGPWGTRWYKLHQVTPRADLEYGDALSEKWQE